MRFFKSFPSFPLLHRRSKSDSSIPKPPPPRDHILPRPQSLDAAQAAVFAAAVPTCPQTFLFPTPSDASSAIFELETANSRLRGDAAIWAADCAKLQSQLEVARADLFTQLHRNSSLQRQLQADRIETDKLSVKLAQYERFLGLLINVGLHQRVLGDAHAALRAGIDPDEALVSAIKEAAAVPTSPWSTIITGVTGPRTTDEYRSSLNMTLKTRRELKDTKKVAKFWKRVAQEDGRNGIVTPSVSSISSINEPLPAERQKAVDELISSRRRASLNSQEAESDSFPVNVSASTSTSSASLANVTPSNSASETLCLSPLASDSFKNEVASLSSNARLFKKGSSKPSRPVLGQRDINVTTRSSQNTGLRANKGKRKTDSQDENVHQLRQAVTLPQPPTISRELSVPQVVPSFSKHSLCSNLLGPLGRIEEEHEESPDTDFPGSPEGDASRDSSLTTWCLLDLPDRDTLVPCEPAISAPARAQDISSTTTSRLPRPVFNRLSRTLSSKPQKRTELASITITAAVPA